MKDKNDSERLKDDEICAKQELIKQHLSDMENMKKKYDDKLECFEKDKAKYMVERQCVEQETRALKDEIRFLHINKYNMEKIIKDKERDIQKHKNSDENYLSQLSKVEEQCKDAIKQCSEVVRTLAIVEANMDEAKKQHKNLKFINDHQNCLLLSYKAMLENGKKDLILSQAMATSSKSIILDDTSREKIVWMERQLAGLKDICKQRNEELNVSREENQELLKSLEKAHILVSKHIETIKNLSDNDRAMQQEINDIKTDCERYREDLESTKMIVVKKDAMLKELKNNAEEKEKDLLVKTEELIEKNKNLLREKEEQNSMWLLKIDAKTTEIGYLKNEVHGIQTILDETRLMLQMKTEEIETLKNNLNTKVRKQTVIASEAENREMTIVDEVTKLQETINQINVDREKLRNKLEVLKTKKEQSSKGTQTEEIKKMDRAPKNTNDGSFKEVNKNDLYSCNAQEANSFNETSTRDKIALSTTKRRVLDNDVGERDYVIAEIDAQNKIEDDKIISNSAHSSETSNIEESLTISTQNSSSKFSLNPILSTESINNESKYQEKYLPLSAARESTTTSTMQCVPQEFTKSPVKGKAYHVKPIYIHSSNETNKTEKEKRREVKYETSLSKSIFTDDQNTLQDESVGESNKCSRNDGFSEDKHVNISHIMGSTEVDHVEMFLTKERLQLKRKSDP